MAEKFTLTDEQRSELRDELVAQIPGKCLGEGAARLCQYGSQTVVGRTEYELAVEPRRLKTVEEAVAKAAERGASADRLCPGIDLSGDRTRCRFGEGNDS